MAPNRPAEVFGYSIEDRGAEAQSVRDRCGCPFVGDRCIKKSRLIAYPMGVCSVSVGDANVAICPRRLLQDQIVFRDIALDYFGSTDNLLLFSEVGLRGVGAFDYVLVHHKPMSSDVDDFVVMELQTDQTTSTGKLVQALRDFTDGQDVTNEHYPFGMNTYDTLKRSYTQMLNKGVVLESWQQRIYWVFQDYVFANLSNRYRPGFAPGSAQTNVFAVYDLARSPERYILSLQRFVSASVDSLFAALRENPGAPSKDQFVAHLEARIRRQKPSLRLDF